MRASVKARPPCPAAAVVEASRAVSAAEAVARGALDEAAARPVLLPLELAQQALARALVELAK